MPETKNTLVHELSLKGCESGRISGVKEVLSFDTDSIRLDTVCGRMQIRGHDLHISQLSLETGNVSLCGIVDSIQYMKGSSIKTEQKKMWQRLLR